MSLRSNLTTRTSQSDVPYGQTSATQTSRSDVPTASFNNNNNNNNSTTPTTIKAPTTISTPNASLTRRILKLTGPAILSNITVPLLGLSDTAIAGHLGAASYLAAMAIGAMMLNVIFWLCGFLRMGTTGLVSQAFGAGDLSAIRSVLRKAFITALWISVFVLILQRPLEQVLFIIMAPDATLSHLASLYFRICIWSVPAQLVIMIVTGYFIGRQNTVIPMAIAIGVNIINIILSIILVFVFETGFGGIAIGTLIANWIGAVVGVMLIQVKERGTRNEGKGQSLWKININLFLRSACIMGVTLAMTAYGSRLGETTLAANAVIMQFFLFFSYFMDGFAFAGEAIVGSSYGAGDYALLKKSVTLLLCWGVFMAATFLLIYLFGSGFITGLLTSSGEVRHAVGEMRWWLVAMPPITVAAFLFDGVYIGLARTLALLVTTLVATAAFFIIAGCVRMLDNTVLWVAFGVYLLLRGVLLGGDYVILQRKLLTL